MAKTTVKRILIVAACAAMLLFAFAASSCSQETDEGVTIDFGSSDIYTVEEMNGAVNLICDEFQTWEGCELHTVTYAGDQCVTDDNLAWMNDLAGGKNYAQVIEFLSSFHSPKQQTGAWEPDDEYTDWQWWLAREDGGDWELLTWGY